MAYRADVDLDFLGKLSSEDLAPLVSVLTHDPKDGEVRLTEELMGSSEYKKYYPDHRRYWKLIAAEIQCFGGNTIATLFRGGKGVLYREVLTDVCGKLKAEYDKRASISRLEEYLLAKVCGVALENMTESQKREFLQTLNASSFGISKITFSPSLASMAGMSGFYIARTLAFMAAPNLVSAGLLTAGAVAGGAGLLTAGAVTGGAGLVAAGGAGAIFPPLAPLLALSGIYEMAGAAYRVTIPVCLIVAALRKQYELSPADVVKIMKYKQFVEMLQSSIEKYQSSDKKKAGLYLVAKSKAKELQLPIDENIKFIIFGVSQDEERRIDDILKNDSFMIPPNVDDARNYALNKCNCEKDTIDAVILAIAELGNDKD